MSKWISVKKKLPKESTPLELHTILVWADDLRFTEAMKGWYFGYCWKIEGSPSSWNITHWQELPKPPRKRGKK